MMPILPGNLNYFSPEMRFPPLYIVTRQAKVGAQSEPLGTTFTNESKIAAEGFPLDTQKLSLDVRSRGMKKDRPMIAW